MSDIKFEVGDPVWSKMKGYCPWPSRIAAPHESSLRNTAADKLKTPKKFYLVYFFGSNNFAWMPDDTIKHYEENKEKNKNGSKTAQFKQGLKQIEDYIARGGKATLQQDTATSIGVSNNNNNNNNNNTDNADSTTAGDSLSNDASNLDGDLPSIDEEIATINNKKPAAMNTGGAAGGATKRSRQQQQAQDSQNDSPSHTTAATASVQRDYSRTPFKTSRKSALKTSSSAAAAGSDSAAAEHATDTHTTTSPAKRVKTTTDDDSYGAASLPSPTISNTTYQTSSKPPTTKSGARNVIFRATQYSDMAIIDTPQISMSAVTAKSKNIRPSTLKFGFIGLGLMGQRLLKNLLNSGHTVSIWNRSLDKCHEFLQAGASGAKTPGDVVSASDIVFSCVSNPLASKEVVFGSFGVLSEMAPDKGFVELSSIDTETSNDISEAILSRGGRYLEAPMISSGKKAAEDGELTIVAAGDKSLYEDCATCFQAIAKKTFYLGPGIGDAVRMNLITSMLYGTIIASVAECCGLIDRASLQMGHFREILQLSMMNCPLLELTVQKIMSGDKSPHMPLVHLQKDLRLALNMSEEYDQSCPITAVANEVFKNSKRFNLGECDASVVHLNARF